MLQKLEGRVGTYRATGVHSVELRLQGADEVIDLEVEQPWVLRVGDQVAVAGELNRRSGRFEGYAYHNVTRSVFGKRDPELLHAYTCLIIGVLGCWAVIPVFTHLPAGISYLSRGKKVDRAATML